LQPPSEHENVVCDPDEVAMGKSGGNKASIDATNAGRDVPILGR
jgi:putative transposase